MSTRNFKNIEEQPTNTTQITPGATNNTTNISTRIMVQTQEPGRFSRPEREGENEVEGTRLQRFVNSERPVARSSRRRYVPPFKRHCGLNRKEQKQPRPVLSSANVKSFNGLTASKDTILCVIPPRECLQTIQAIRRQHDVCFERHLPSVNIFCPFLENTGEVAGFVNEVLEPCCKYISKFDLSLTFIGKNDNESIVDKTRMVVRPRHCSRLQNLYKTLKNLLPPHVKSIHEANNSLYPTKPYRPHLTLGQIGNNKIDDVILKTEEGWKPVCFTVDRLYVCVKSLDGKKYSIQHEIMLQQNPAEKMEELTVPSAPPAPKPPIPQQEDEICIMQENQSSPISQSKPTIPEKKTYLKSDPTIPRPRPVSLPPRVNMHRPRPVYIPVPTQFASCQYIQYPMAYEPAVVPSRLPQLYQRSRPRHAFVMVQTSQLHQMMNRARRSYNVGEEDASASTPSRSSRT